MKNISESDINLYKKRNQKLFVLYKFFANDLLFYYTISFLFLSNIKGLSTAEIVFAESFYPLFKLLFQFPCTIGIQKVGKKRSLLFSNLCIGIYLFLVLILNTSFELILANIFCALGFVIKGIAESNFLFDSLENTSDRQENFSKIEGKANAGFFLIDAVTALVSGFLYSIDPYIPMVLSCICMIIAILINCFFREIPTSNHKEIVKEKFTKQLKTQVVDTFSGFKYIFKSTRLRALILFNALLVSLLILMVTLHRSILDSIGVTSKYFGIIFAIMGLIISYSSSRSVHIHEKYHNKTLSILGVFLTISIIISGLCTMTNLPTGLMYFILLAMIAISYTVKGPHYVLIKQYLNSFCDSDMRIKIYSANLFFEYICTAAISMTTSFVLNYYSSSYTTLIVGIISFILMLLLIKYMSTRVGLRPEEYSEKDIYINK